MHFLVRFLAGFLQDYKFINHQGTIAKIMCGPHKKSNVRGGGAKMGLSHNFHKTKIQALFLYLSASKQAMFVFRD